MYLCGSPCTYHLQLCSSLSLSLCKYGEDGQVYVWYICCVVYLKFYTTFVLSLTRSTRLVGSSLDSTHNGVVVCRGGFEPPMFS